MDAESAYVFRHAVLRDAAYQLQLPTAREKLHVLALEVIESVAAKDELPHFAEELARHAQIGKRTDLEVVYLKMAAQFAAKQFRGADAAGLWARLGAHPGVNDETAISAFCDESALWVTVGSIPRAEAAVQAGRKRLAAWRSKGRTHREAVQLEARLALVLGNALAALPRKEEREAALLMACDLAKSVNDFAIASSALNQLVRHYDQAGDAVRSKQTAEQALLEAERSKDEVAIAVARNSRAVVDLNHGAIDAAIETWNDLLEKSFEIPVLARVQALNGLGNAMRAQGRHSDACEYYARGLREAQQAGAAPGIVLCQSNLAMSLMESGKLQEARNTYQKALASARESGSVSDEARVQVNLGNLLIALGEYSEAEECLRESVLLSRRLKHPIQEAFATGNFAPVLMSRGKLGMALRSFEVAKRLMEASGRANTAAVYAAMCAELKLMLQDIAGADAELAFASQRLTAAEDPAWYAEYILPARFRRAACDTPSAPMVARLEAVAATSKEFRISCGFESDSAAARAIQECEGALQEIRQAVAQHRTPLVLGGKLVRELNAEFRRAMVARADALGIKWDDDLSAAMRANIAAVQEPDWRSEDLTY